MSKDWAHSIDSHIEIALYDDGHPNFRPKSRTDLFRWLADCCCRRRYWNDDWETVANRVFRDMNLAGRIETVFPNGDNLVHYKLSEKGVKVMYDDIDRSMGMRPKEVIEASK